MLRRRGADRLLKRPHIVGPELAFVYVSRRKLPVLLRVIEAFQKAALLFFSGNMQEKLENDHTLPGQVVLEMRYVGEPFVPDALAHEDRRQPLPLQDILVHSHNEDLLLVGSIEYSDPPTLG